MRKIKAWFGANPNRVVIMMLLGVVAIGYCSKPRAEAFSKCSVFVDYALNVRALSVAGVPDDLADTALGMVYELRGTDENKRNAARELMLVAQAARSSQKTPSDFATEFGTACMKSGGSVREALGFSKS